MGIAVNKFTHQGATLVVAPTGSGKTYNIVKDMLAKIEKNKKVTIVVNSNANVYNVLNECAKQLGCSVGELSHYGIVKFNGEVKHLLKEKLVKEIPTWVFCGKPLHEYKCIITNHVYLNNIGHTHFIHTIYEKWILPCDHIYIDEAHEYVKSLHTLIKLEQYYNIDTRSSFAKFTASDIVKQDTLDERTGKVIKQTYKRQQLDYNNQHNANFEINNFYFENTIPHLQDNGFNLKSMIRKWFKPVSGKKYKYENDEGKFERVINLELRDKEPTNLEPELFRFYMLLKQSNGHKLVTKKVSDDYERSTLWITNLDIDYLIFYNLTRWLEIRDKCCLYTATIFDNIVEKLGVTVKRVNTTNIKIKQVNIYGVANKMNTVLSKEDNQLAQRIINDERKRPIFVCAKKTHMHDISNMLREKEHFIVRSSADNNLDMINSVESGDLVEDNCLVSYAGHPRMTGANMTRYNAIVIDANIQRPIVGRLLFDDVIDLYTDKWQFITQIVGRIMRTDDNETDFIRDVHLVKIDKGDFEKLNSILTNSFPGIKVELQYNDLNEGVINKLVNVIELLIMRGKIPKKWLTRTQLRTLIKQFIKFEYTLAELKTAIDECEHLFETSPKKGLRLI